MALRPEWSHCDYYYVKTAEMDWRYTAAGARAARRDRDDHAGGRDPRPRAHAAGQEPDSPGGGRARGGGVRGRRETRASIRSPARWPVRDSMITKDLCTYSMNFLHQE